jgi:hypothetical protein
MRLYFEFGLDAAMDTSDTGEKLQWNKGISKATSPASMQG